LPQDRFGRRPRSAVPDRQGRDGQGNRQGRRKHKKRGGHDGLQDKGFRIFRERGGVREEPRAFREKRESGKRKSFDKGCEARRSHRQERLEHQDFEADTREKLKH